MHLFTRNVNTAFENLVNLFGNRGWTGLDQLRKWSHGSSRAGDVVKIDEPATITYSHPGERVLFNAERDANPFFHLYEALWMLAGRNDTKSIGYYNSKVTEVASDNGREFNGAYGYRWRHGRLESADPGNPLEYQKGHGYATDQLVRLVEHLRWNPESRRAVLQMWTLDGDLLKIDSSKDVCCNLSVMFSIKKCDCVDNVQCLPGKVPDVTVMMSRTAMVTCPECKGRHTTLDMTVVSRSEDLIWGLLGSDYPTFSILQEYMAAHLGVEMGLYHHMINNLHVYTERFQPEKWLGHKDVISYGDRDDRYRVGSLFPLVKDIKTFDEELPAFVTYNSMHPPILPRPWEEPFFQRVAQPMFSAYHSYKVKDYALALRHTERIEAEDWRAVALGWIQRRVK